MSAGQPAAWPSRFATPVREYGDLPFASGQPASPRGASAEADIIVALQDKGP
jgi:hypothetical protein